MPQSNVEILSNATEDIITNKKTDQTYIETIMHFVQSELEKAFQEKLNLQVLHKLSSKLYSYYHKSVLKIKLDDASEYLGRKDVSNGYIPKLGLYIIEHVTKKKIDDKSPRILNNDEQRKLEELRVSTERRRASDSVMMKQLSFYNSAKISYSESTLNLFEQMKKEVSS